MRRQSLWFLLGIFLVSCEKDVNMDNLSPELTVYTDYDNSVDFNNYKTYYLPDSILDVSGNAVAYWDDELALSVIKEVASNMEGRGFTRLSTEQKSEADVGLQLTYVPQSLQIVSGAWWPVGFWGGWWSGWFYPYPRVVSFDTQTFLMEMVDLTANDGGQEEHILPVIWYVATSGYRYGSLRVNVQLMMDAANQAFAQSSYVRTINTEEGGL